MGRNPAVHLLCALLLTTLLCGCKKASEAPQSGATSEKQITVAVMPKSKGNAYFIACRKGAEDASRELDCKLIWDGPTEPDPAKQNEIVETWITRGVDVIAAAVENRRLQRQYID